MWINGREEKGILTTQAKADTAYRTIVGVERRDPSVVHWREGNRVTVRVFPCLPGEARQFKIGITSPLRLENRLGQSQQLVYENAWFEGPNSRTTTETVKLEFSQKPHNADWPECLKPGFFDPPIRKQLIRESTYQPRWAVRFDAPALATSGFRLGSTIYQLQPARQQMESFHPKAVFLDLNRNWTDDDINRMLKLAGNRPVWVYDEELVQLTGDNRDEITARLLQQRFSVFPFYRIPEPASALLVTKSTENGPQLEDLANSPYAEALKRQPIDQPALRTFCLSNASEVVKTLSKLGVLQVDQGTFDELKWLLGRQLFVRQSVADASVVLPQSGVRIVRTESAETGHFNAAGVPDHLVRLYAYNHLMSQIGRHYFSKDFHSDSLVAQAQQAHIVSPISSLIVLETQKDYDRFGIKKPQNSLENATLKNTGAVPEPREWALLALLAVWVLYTWWKGRYVGI